MHEILTFIILFDYFINLKDVKIIFKSSYIILTKNLNCKEEILKKIILLFIFIFLLSRF